MALEAGSATVNPVDRTVAGSGLACAIAESLVAGLPGSPGQSIHPQMARGVEHAANLLAAPIINYLLANAEITVTVKTTDVGLQRTPTPNDPNTATLGPSADVEIEGALT